MKMKYILTSASALLVLQASAANVILNGDFETATITDPVGNAIGSELGNVNYVDATGTGFGRIDNAGVSNWTPSTRMWYVIDAGNLLGEGTSNNLVRLDGDSSVGAADILSQGGISLTNGQTVTLDLTTFAEVNDNTMFATLVSGGTTIDLLGAGGVNIDSTDDATQNVNSGSVAVTATGTYTLNIWVNQTAGANHVFADNISLDAVPEPSSTALLGLGGIALILRRRK